METTPQFWEALDEALGRIIAERRKADPNYRAPSPTPSPGKGNGRDGGENTPERERGASQRGGQ